VVSSYAAAFSGSDAAEARAAALSGSFRVGDCGAAVDLVRYPALYSGSDAAAARSPVGPPASASAGDDSAIISTAVDRKLRRKGLFVRILSSSFCVDRLPGHGAWDSAGRRTVELRSKSVDH